MKEGTKYRKEENDERRVEPMVIEDKNLPNETSRQYSVQLTGLETVWCCCNNGQRFYYENDVDMEERGWWRRRSLCGTTATKNGNVKPLNINR